MEEGCLRVEVRLGGLHGLQRDTFFHGSDLINATE